MTLYLQAVLCASVTALGTLSAKCRAESTLDVHALTVSVQTPHRFGSLVVAPSLKEGTFDSHLTDCPFPYFHDGRYWMTYIGWDSIGYRTGLASSSDLVEWKKEGLLLDRGPKGSPTEFNVAMTCIARDNELFSSGSLKQVDGKYIGTYHAYPGEGYESGPASIGICTSTDLQTWHLEEPALKPDPDISWEAGGLYKSWLMEHDGTWYLFYNAKDNQEQGWKEQTGIATSTDLKTWTRSPNNPVLRNGPKGALDEQFASDPCVFRHKDHWVMFYFGLATDGHAREGVAFSRDLLTWEKQSAPLLEIGNPGTVDSTHAHKPGMIARDGVLFHFYCAVSPVSECTAGEVEVVEKRGISFATSEPLK